MGPIAKADRQHLTTCKAMGLEGIQIRVHPADGSPPFDRVIEINEETWDMGVAEAMGLKDMDFRLEIMPKQGTPITAKDFGDLQFGDEPRRGVVIGDLKEAGQ